MLVSIRMKGSHGFSSFGRTPVIRDGTVKNYTFLKNLPFFGTKTWFGTKARGQKRP